MFKKLTAMLCALGVALGASAGVLAADQKPKGETVEISFKVGDSTLKINDEQVTVRTPYVVDGVTLVPVRVITEAFGAEVDWNGETQEVRINYSDVEILLTIGQTDAYVNGSRVELLAPPALAEDTTMLPLRFITENFGADVSYDGTDGAILVEKEMTDSDSIMDYALILKRSNKPKAGDAYLGWSMERSPKFKLVERSFDGYVNIFYDESRAARIGVVIQTVPEITVEELLETCRSAIQNKTISRLDKAQLADGTPYVYAQYRDADAYYYDKVFIEGDKLYAVYTEMSIETEKQEFEDIMALVDTYTLSFSETDTENLSDVNQATGMRTYKSKKMGIEMDIPGAYLSHESADQENEISFIQVVDAEDTNAANIIHLVLYSVQNDKNYKSWAERDLKRNSYEMNPELSTFGPLKETTIDGKNAVYYEYQVKNGERTEYTRDLFIDAGDYFYNVAVQLANDTNAAVEINKITNSIRFSEIDAEELGLIIRTEKDEDAYKTYTSETTGISFDAPSTWTEAKAADGIMVMDYDQMRYLQVSTMTKAGMEYVPSIMELAKQLQQNYAANKLITLDKAGTQTTKVDGKTAYWFKFTARAANTGSVSIVYTYIFETADVFYMATFQTDECNDGGRAQEIREKFLNTLKVAA